MIRNQVPFPVFFLSVLTLFAGASSAQLGADQAVTVENSTGRLHVVDATTASVVSTLFLGSDVADVTITPDGTTALVTSFGQQAVTFVDLTGPAPAAIGATQIPLLALDIDVSCTSTGFAVITDGVNTSDPSVGSNIVSLNLATGAVVSNLLLDISVQSNAITPDGTRVLAGSFLGSVVRVIDMSPTGVLTDTGQSVTVGVNPRNVTISPDGQLALVANAGATVTVLDLTGPVVSNGNLAFAGSSLQSIAFAPAGDQAYVLDTVFSRVYVLSIDAMGNVTQAGFMTHTGSPSLPFLGADQVAVSPDATRVYARHPGGLSILDPGTNTELANAPIAGSTGGGVAAPCDGGEVPNQDPLCDAGAPITAECTSSAGAQVTLNGVASDPDGDPIAVQWTVSDPGVVLDDPTSLTPTGTFPLGSTTATLAVTDDRGGSCSSDVLVQVVDTTAPAITVSLDRAGGGDECDDDDEGCFVVSFAVSDACDPDPNVTAVLVIPGCADIPVYNGQLIEFEFEDDECEIEYEDGMLEVEAPSLTLRVTALDASGNGATAEAAATGLGGDNDDCGDDDD